MPRKLLKEFGSHGRSVRVFVESFADSRRQSLVRVQWRESGLRKTESLPDSGANRRTAIAFAEGVAERLALKGTARATPITMLELGQRYEAAHPVPQTWRPKTSRTWRARWKVWIAFAAPDRRIDTVTPETIDDFRGALAEQGYAVNQVANMVQMVKAVYRFARARKFLQENPIADYVMKLSRDQRRLEVPEWSIEECGRILAELSPRDARRWRAYVAILLDALLGGRSNALLHLEWRDIDMAERTITWRRELDKLAKQRVQPLPRDAVRALRIARVWRARLGYTGPYVLPAVMGSLRGQPRELAEWEQDPKHKRLGKTRRRNADQPYSYQALNYSLRQAAERAGVPWVKYRAMHGFRRMVVNNVLAVTGNLTRAGQFIGDGDLRTLSRSYVRERAEELRDVADSIPSPTRERHERKPKTKRNMQRNDNGPAFEGGAEIDKA